MMLTLDDFDLENKTLLVRLDLNSPMSDGEIRDDTRFRRHLETLKMLENSKSIALAHQSRPGKSDFTTLAPHAKKLSDLLGKEVRYVDDIFGTHAIDSIKALRTGETLLLENVRFYSEESIEQSPSDHAKTHLVKKLSPYADMYINDALSVSHRSHASIVGFPFVLPSVAGKLMEEEVTMLDKVLSEGKDRSFLLGGDKVDDSLRVIKNVISDDRNKVFVAGAVANLLLIAAGIDVGEPSMEFLRKMNYLHEVDEARNLLSNNNLALPTDLAISKNGKREEINVKDLPTDYPICDIGSNTIAKFSEELSSSEMVVVNGPAGVFKTEEFAYGTLETLRAASNAKLSVAGGGSTARAIRKLGMEDKITHISSGGGACIMYLSGEKLPGIEILKERC